MATVDNTEPNPWGDHIDASRVTGDYWYVRGKFAKWMWAVAALLCFTVPPAGVFLAVYFYSASIHHADDTIELDLEAGA